MSITTRRKISQKEINDALSQSQRPTLFSNLPVPLNDLSDRSFEILLYHIFKERLKNGDSEISPICDNISLMQGVNEQGRDVSFYKNNIPTGVIQCKKYKQNISKPEVCQEILKFLLYYLHDKSIIGDIENFYYFFAVSTGFSGTAIGLFNNTYKSITDDPKLKDWVEGIIKDYPKKFKGLSYEAVEKDLKLALAKIKFKKIIPQDVEFWLSEFENLSKTFFKILTVTDNTLIEQIVTTYLKPILHKLNLNEIDTPDYTFRFKDYLKRIFEEYSSAKTLVFGNQQKRLDEIYYPLTVVKKEELRKRKDNQLAFKIDKFNDDFIQVFRKVLIIDDGGMGKSTLLKWLFLSSIKLNKGIPIFIELRKLDSENTLIEEITTKLNPINPLLEKKATAEILAQGSFIFFFDGYDEIKFANRPEVTKDLQSFISKLSNNCLFIITSRPEQALLSFSDFQEFNVRKLERVEAFDLIRKIDNYQERSKRLIEQIDKKRIDQIDDFLGNPLLVSLLYKKFEYRETISFNKQEFYYEVFEALFQAHDLSKGDSYTRDKESGLSLAEFFQMLRGIGYKSIKEGIEFNESQIISLIEQVKTDFCKAFNSELFLSDLVKAVPLFQRDGLLIKWAHKSIQQYFAAEWICRDSKEKQEKILIAIYKSNKIDFYYNILELCYIIDYKTFRKSVLYSFAKEFVDYCRETFKWNSTSPLIPNSSIGLRQSLSFQSRIFLFNLIYKEEVLEKVNKSFGGELGDIGVYGAKTKNGISIGLQLSSYMGQSLKQLLRRNGNEIFLSPIEIENQEFESIDLGFEIGREPIFLNDDRSELPINKLQSFDKVNELLSIISFGPSLEKCKMLIEQIEGDNSRVNDNDDLGLL